MTEFSETWTYMDDAWHEGNVPVVGAREHAFWLGSSVFDGARAFEGVTPDLDLHCARVNKSAEALGLKPTKTDQEIYDLCREGVAKFDKDAALYIRPMYFATQGGPLAVAALPESTKFLLSIYVTPMPAPTAGLTVTVSPFRPSRAGWPSKVALSTATPRIGKLICCHPSTNCWYFAVSFSWRCSSIHSPSY